MFRHKEERNGLFYKLQLYSEYLFKIWRSFNEFQQQDYLFLVRYKLVNEMIILDK